MKFTANTTRSLTMLSAALLTAGGALAIDWAGTENLAKGAEVVTSSNEAQASFITDGNTGTRWQAEGAANNRGANDFVLINLGEAKTFSDIELKWEASNATKYSVYVSETAIPYAARTFTEGEGEGAREYTYNVVDADWLATATPAATSTLENNVGAEDMISFSAPVTAQYILIYVEEYSSNAEAYGSSLFEVRVANIANRDAISQITVDVADITEGEDAVINVAAKNAVGEAADLAGVENLSVTVDGNAVAGAGGKYTVAGLTAGKHTVEVSGEAEGKALTASATFTVLYDWSKVEKAPVTPLAARVKEGEDVELGNAVAANAADGDLETLYEYNGSWGGGDSWVLVDLGCEYVVDAVGVVTGANSGGKYKFFYTVEAETLPVSADVTPNALGLVELGWNVTASMDRFSNSVNTFFPEAPIRARYIVVADSDNPNGKPQYKEIYVKGRAVDAPAEATEITSFTSSDNYLLTGEKVELSAVVIDQYGSNFTGEVTYTAKGGVVEGNVFSADEIGSYTVTATCGKLSKELTIEVVATPDTKVAEAREVTLDGEAANDVVAGVEVAFDLDQELIIDLRNSHDLDLIKLRWEAAAPADYTVVAHSLDGNSWTVLEVKGRKFVGGVNPVDRIYNEYDKNDNGTIAIHGVSLKGVKSLTIVPTAKDHGYKLRLFGVDLYGTDLHDVESGVAAVGAENGLVDVYTVAGVRVRAAVAAADATAGLPAGLYIVGGKKVLVK